MSVGAVATNEPKYSICITHYNDEPTVRQSIDATLNETDGRFEVVVVDQRSTDGSRQILQEFADRGKIRLFDMRIRNRGLGRQLAFEHSRGRYIISGMDTDDVAIPGRLSLILDFYHRRCEGKLLRLQWGGYFVAPSELITRLGGWRDLHWHQNWDIFERAARIGEYTWTIFKVMDRIQPGPTHTDLAGSIIRKNRARYRKYVDELRLRKRHGPFEEGEKFSVGKAIDYALALVSLPYFGHVNPTSPVFDDCSPELFVDSSQWWHGAGHDESQEIMMYSRLLKRSPEWVVGS